MELPRCRARTQRRIYKTTIEMAAGGIGAGLLVTLANTHADSVPKVRHPTSKVIGVRAGINTLNTLAISSFSLHSPVHPDVQFTPSRD